MITISDQARSIVALVEARDRLAQEAANCNEHTRQLIVSFNRMMQETSTLQKAILEKMAAVDETIKKIAQSC